MRSVHVRMEPTGERKEKDTLLEMGTFNCVNDAPNTGQAKRMQTDGSTSSDTKTPDVADDNENTSTIENEIIDDDDSSSSSSDEDEQSHVLDPNRSVDIWCGCFLCSELLGTAMLCSTCHCKTACLYLSCLYLCCLYIY